MSSVTSVTGVTAANTYTPAADTETGGGNVDFGALIAEALREEITGKAVTAGQGTDSSGLLAGASPYQTGGGLEQMILAASASGETSDAMIALFMLCMMMQSNPDGEFGQMMGAMSAMLTQITGDTETMRKTVMSSEYHPYILDTIDKNVFGTKTPAVTGTGSAIIPVECWKPTTPAITSSADARTAAQYRAVIDQFDVENEERYEPFRNGYTYCNIFVWDVTSAMGCEIPHYVNPTTGEPMTYPDTKGAKELGAVAMEQWLAEHGEKYGWREVTAETAQKYANAGKAAITTAGKIGHVQVVCPSGDGQYDPVRGVTVAQAGSKVTNYTYLSGIYSSSGMKNVRYFVHD